jgi:hypothetical protein
MGFKKTDPPAALQRGQGIGEFRVRFGIVVMGNCGWFTDVFLKALSIFQYHRLSTLLSWRGTSF